MSYTILSAIYANSDGTAAVVQTAEAGAVVFSKGDTPELWTTLSRWGTPTAYRPSPAPSALTYKRDIWRRCTDEQVALLDSALELAPPRLRRMWDDGEIIHHDAPEFPLLRSQVVLLVGEAETDRLLAPST